MRGQLSAK